LKTKKLQLFLCTIVALLLISFSDPYTIKRISDLNFRYEFYTTSKKIKPKSNKIYYWFKGGLIHNAQAGVAGELLNEKFTKMYHSNQLAEQGEFKNGLKVGLWKTWHPNGIVETTQYWDNGLKKGLFYHYDKNGDVIEKGNFKTDKKQGQWIDYVKKDTIIFKKGVVFVEKPKLSKEEKKKQKEEKKKTAAAKKALKEVEKAKKAAEKQAEKADKNKPKTNTTNEGKPQKNGFFKRLFAKKQPKQNTNGQGT
jgi:antitoxin component YwqK of YwqJK toxin-antitoxin module